MGDLRYTRKMRAIRGRYKADRPQPCMRCGQPIDYDAPPDDPNAFNLGHIKSYSSHPELRQDPGNLQQEHAGQRGFGGFHRRGCASAGWVVRWGVRVAGGRAARQNTRSCSTRCR